MKMKSIYIFPIILVVLFGGIMLSNSFGWWQTESTKVPTLIKTGDFEGMPDPSDIRGSYSFGDVEAAFSVPASVIAEAFQIESDNPKDILAKDLETYYGENEDGLEIGTGALRLFIAYYVGLPYEGDDAISQSAIAILEKEGKWSSELDVLFEGRVIDLTSSYDDSKESEVIIESIQEEEHDEDEQLVKGKTTVAEVLSWGISLEEIEAILTVDVENDHMLIRDICTQNELSFSEVKTALNLLLEP